MKGSDTMHLITRDDAINILTHSLSLKTDINEYERYALQMGANALKTPNKADKKVTTVRIVRNKQNYRVLETTGDKVKVSTYSLSFDIFGFLAALNSNNCKIICVSDDEHNHVE